MDVEKSNVNGSTLLSIEGMIRLGDSAKFFAETLRRTLAEEVGDVMVDLSGIDYIDSTGIGELVAFLGRFQEAGRKLILVNPSKQIVKLLRTAHLDSMFPIFESAEAATAGADS